MIESTAPHHPLHAFRDGALAHRLAHAIAQAMPLDGTVRLMEFCGGHTHALSRHGLQDLLPERLTLIHGPGCPVCVLPIGRVDQAIALARQPGVTVCCYGDVLRVPASDRLSLRKAQALGAHVRLVTSPLQALTLAREHPEQQVVFLAIGFETTTPPTAVAVLQAQAQGLRNFSVLCHHVLTPAAMEAILQGPAPVSIDGFIGPGHVSTIVGSAPFEPIAQRYRQPIVIAGFEPLDMLQAILMLLQQKRQGRHEVETAFTRAVSRAGNRKAQALMQQVFTRRESFEWRGLGTLPFSALRLNDAFAAFDAEQRFQLDYQAVPDHKACECADIVRGEKRPQECRIFGTGCTPDQPIGACMVSPEGACAAHYQYGRWRDTAPPAAHPA